MSRMGGILRRMLISYSPQKRGACRQTAIVYPRTRLIDDLSKANVLVKQGLARKTHAVDRCWGHT